MLLARAAAGERVPLVDLVELDGLVSMRRPHAQPRPGARAPAGLRAGWIRASSEEARHCCVRQ